MSKRFIVSISLSLSLSFFFSLSLLPDVLIRVCGKITRLRIWAIFIQIYEPRMANRLLRRGYHATHLIYDAIQNYNGIDNAWASCAKHQDADTLPKWRYDVVNYRIILWNIAPAINTACHSHCLYHVFEQYMYCLFSNPVICLYIIVLLKHALYFRNKYCLN